MPCNHPKKIISKSISKHEMLCSSECCIFWNALQTAEVKKLEGNMPSMDTYTNQNQVFMYRGPAALSAAHLCSSLEMRGGPVEQAFHSVRSTTGFCLWGNVPSIEESILSARRCFQIQLKKPWSDFYYCIQ